MCDLTLNRTQFLQFLCMCWLSSLSKRDYVLSIYCFKDNLESISQQTTHVSRWCLSCGRFTANLSRQNNIKKKIKLAANVHAICWVYTYIKVKQKVIALNCVSFTATGLSIHDIIDITLNYLYAILLWDWLVRTTDLKLKESAVSEFLLKKGCT